MISTRFAAIALCCMWLASCQRADAPVSSRSVPSADARVRALADGYLAAYFERYPDQATIFGVPGRRHDRLPDNSQESLKAWWAREDSWLAEARAIDPSMIDAAPLRATYAIAREVLEASAGTRRCRTDLWNVSQMTGWQVQDGYLVTIQPVGTEEARRDAIARWSALPAYLETEMANLHDGIRQGYTAPKLNVRIVIGQMDALLSTPVSESPFDSPSVRDKTPRFAREFDALVRDRINPAIGRYRDFLRDEYLGAAREAMAVSAHPNGADCYEGLVRSFSTLRVPAGEVHQLGLRQIESLTAEMKTIAERSFHTDDVAGLLQRLRTDKQFMFKSRAELIGYSANALARAKAEAPHWFGLLPKADVETRPYPAFREKNAPNEYNPPAEDGSRPGIYFISAYDAEKKSRASTESTTFHETIPGHHLQTAIALERRDIHPLGRYLFNNGYGEGWGLYAERLADEMKLYSTDLDRLGMLSDQALRASRLVVDPGLHVLGWTRQQAIDYLLAHTSESEGVVASEVDRYIVWPGQATSYMLGMLEIRKAREEAQKVMGARFDIKAFHDRVLEDGGVPLAFLTAKIRAWARASS